MAESNRAGEIFARALAYPYESPPYSFVFDGERAVEAPRLAEYDFSDRTAVLAYGANAAPETLARKLTALPASPMLVTQADLCDFDVVYSAHVSPHGAVPANLYPRAGTITSVFVAFPNSEQLARISASEPNYELRELRDAVVHTDLGPADMRARAFVSRHGCLTLDGEPVALAAIEATGRRHRSMREAEVLELVRRRLAPEASLERFVLDCVDAGGIAPLPALRS